MAVTIRQIASHAGLSRQTVSAVLGKKGDLYRPETRATVLKAAEDLGYRLNPSARAIGRGRFGAVGVLMSTVDRRSALSQIIDGIQHGLSDAELAVRFTHVTDDDLADERFLQQLPSKLAVDGLLVNYTHQFPPMLMAILDKYQIPSIWTNVKQDHDSVHPDDIAAGRVGVECLAGLGHRRIGYVTLAIEEDRHYSLHDRRLGYALAMQSVGWGADILEYAHHTNNEQRVGKVIRWLRGDDRPTAVHTQSLGEAVTTYIAATSLGLRVPRDLSILTLMAESQSSSGVEFGSVRLPTNGVGRRAVELVRRKIRNPERRLPTEALPVELDRPDDLRRTCAPPADRSGVDT